MFKKKNSRAIKAGKKRKKKRKLTTYHFSFYFVAHFSFYMNTKMIVLL